MAGADHPGFVDDEHGPEWQAAAGVVGVAQQPVDGACGDARVGGELGGGAGGEGTTDHGGSGRGPGVAGGGEGVGFPGASFADDHVHGVPGASEVGDHGGLFPGDGRPRSQRRRDRYLVGVGDARVESRDGGGENVLFEVEQFNGGVARFGGGDDATVAAADDRPVHHSELAHCGVWVDVLGEAAGARGEHGGKVVGAGRPPPCGRTPRMRGCLLWESNDNKESTRRSSGAMLWSWSVRPGGR